MSVLQEVKFFRSWRKMFHSKPFMQTVQNTIDPTQ